MEWGPRKADHGIPLLPRLLRAALHRSHAKIHHSRPLYTSFALGVVKHANTFSYETAKESFGFAPTSAEQAISDTLDYLKEQGLLK
jgi:hypothetical protein